MRRPKLNEIPLESARDGSLNILIGEKEWDEEIEAAYDAGHILIEFGSNELAVKAFRKTIVNFHPGLFTKEGSL